MTEAECYKAIGTAFTELSKIKGNGSPGTPDYQTEWRHNKVKELCDNINSKRIPIACIVDWVKKTENYVRRHITSRTKFTNTFYARDVIKFLCEEWGFDYPPELSEGAAA